MLISCLNNDTKKNRPWLNTKTINKCNTLTRRDVKKNKNKNMEKQTNMKKMDLSRISENPKTEN